MAGTALAIGTYKGLNDCKIAKLLTDVSGAEATYDAFLDVNIQKMDVSSVEYDDAELAYDEGIGDVDSKLKSIKGKMTVATLDMDAFVAMAGGTVTATGTGATAITSYSLGGDDKPNYVKIAFKSEYDESISLVKDKHITLCKCKVKPNFGTLQQSSDGYTTFDMEYTAIPLKGSYENAAGTSKSKCLITLDNYAAVTAIA